MNDGATYVFISTDSKRAAVFASGDWAKRIKQLLKQCGTNSGYGWVAAAREDSPQCLQAYGPYATRFQVQLHLELCGFELESSVVARIDPSMAEHTLRTQQLFLDKGWLELPDDRIVIGRHRLGILRPLVIEDITSLHEQRVTQAQAELARWAAKVS